MSNTEHPEEPTPADEPAAVKRKRKARCTTRGTKIKGVQVGRQTRRRGKTRT